MKTITLFKVFTVIALACIINISAQAQVNDTVVVQVSPTLVIKVSASNLLNVRKTEVADSLIRQFQKEFSDVKSQIMPYEMYDITYLQNGFLKIDSLSGSQLFNANKQGLVKSTNNSRCRLLPKQNAQCGSTFDDLSIVIYFKDLNELDDPNIITAVNQSMAQVMKPARFSKNWFFNNEQGKTTLTREEITNTVHQDQIYLSAGMGAALIKNTGMVNIGFTAGISLGSRGRDKHRVFVTDEMNYVFSTNSSFTINNFLSMGYAHNFSRNADKPKWYGLEAGFLTNKKSNFFDDNTYRLGLIINPVEKVNIKPFLYFEDNFQKVYPGIGITIDF